MNLTVSQLLFRASRAGSHKSAKIESMWTVSPLIRSEWLSHELGITDGVNLKMETLQPSSSFKIRGISWFMSKVLVESKDIDTFITTSSANAGMAVAYAARELQCKCLVILDETQKQNELVHVLKSYYGATIEFKGSNWNEADQYAHSLCSKSTKLQYVPMVCCYQMIPYLIP